MGILRIVFPSFSFDLLFLFYCWEFDFCLWDGEWSKKVEFFTKLLSRCRFYSFPSSILHILFHWLIMMSEYFHVFFAGKMFSSLIRGLGAAKSAVFRAQHLNFPPSGFAAASLLQLQQCCGLHFSPTCMWVFSWSFEISFSCDKHTSIIIFFFCEIFLGFPDYFYCGWLTW